MPTRIEVFPDFAAYQGWQKAQTKAVGEEESNAAPQPVGEEEGEEAIQFLALQEEGVTQGEAAPQPVPLEEEGEAATQPVTLEEEGAHRPIEKLKKRRKPRANGKKKDQDGKEIMSEVAPSVGVRNSKGKRCNKFITVHHVDGHRAKGFRKGLLRQKPNTKREGSTHIHITKRTK